MSQPRHGSPADRGSADAYYYRPCNPHYYTGDTHTSQLVQAGQMTAEERAEYTEAYNNETDRKDYGDF